MSEEFWGGDEHLCPPEEERYAVAWDICMEHARKRERAIMRRQPKPLRHPHEDWEVIFRFPVKKGDLSQACQSYLREWKGVMGRFRGSCA